MRTDAEATPEPGVLSSFWTHVEELRRAIIRSAIAIGIAFVICFAFGKEIVGVLDYPLRNIDIFTKPTPTVTFELGKGKFGPYDVTREEFPALPPGDAPHAVFKFGTKLVDGEQVVTLRLDPDADASQSLRVRLSNLTPNEGFFVGFRLAIYAALVVSSPFWIYFMGSFILPAFHLHERKVIFGWMGWSVFLFLLGVLSTYFLLLPVALRASASVRAMAASA